MVSLILLSPMVVALFGAIAVTAMFGAIIMMVMSGRDRTSKRIATATEGRNQKIASIKARETASYRKKAVSDSLKEIDDKKNKDKKVSLRLRLERAGLSITPKTFWLLSIVSGIVSALLIYTSLESSTLQVVAALIGLFVGMFGLPRWMLAKITSRRQQKFLKVMANSMDIIVRGVKSGLPLNECLQIIARESPEPVQSEFKELVDEIRVGVPVPEALERMSERMPLPEVRFFTIVVGIQQTSGGNLSEALDNLASVLRDRIKMQMKVKAMSAEANASAMVLGSLPPAVGILMNVFNPKYMDPLFTTSTGNFLIAIGVCMMTMGVLIMRKMINFKF